LQKPGHGSSGHGSYTNVLIVYFQTQGPMHLHIYRLICTNVAYNSAILEYNTLITAYNSAI